MPFDVQALLKESKAEYRQLGKSGLRVSVPILGAMSIGTKEWQQWVIEEDEALPLLKAAYDRGITTWDTANVYSNGVSEELIAKAIKKYNLPRHKLTILSKCFGIVGESPDIRSVLFRDELPQLKDYTNQGGLSRAAIFNAVDASLKRLDMEYMDLLQIHRLIPIRRSRRRWRRCTTSLRAARSDILEPAPCGRHSLRRCSL